MPTGIQLHGKLIIERAKDGDLAMIETALNAFSLRPLIGAQLARGCGEVCGTFEVKVGDVVSKVITVGGWEPAKVVDFAAVAA
jgi:hypothetical protein